MSKVVYHIQVHAMTPRGDVRGILFYDVSVGLDQRLSPQYTISSREHR